MRKGIPHSQNRAGAKRKCESLGIVNCIKLGRVITSDHESNGKLYRHICALCLSLGKQFSHPEKDC